MPAAQFATCSFATWLSPAALAFIEWRIAGKALLNLENEGFQTDTQLQRLDVLQEFVFVGEELKVFVW